MTSLQLKFLDIGNLARSKNIGYVIAAMEIVPVHLQMHGNIVRVEPPGLKISTACCSYFIPDKRLEDFIVPVKGRLYPELEIPEAPGFLVVVVTLKEPPTPS